MKMKEVKISPVLLLPIGIALILIGWFLGYRGWELKEVEPLPGVKLVPPTKTDGQSIGTMTPESTAPAVVLTNPTSTLTSTSTSPPLSHMFTVYANEGWQNTGIYIEAGDVVQIDYISGKWSFWSGNVAPHDANGDPNGYVCAQHMPASRCSEPVPNAIKGSLVARIGDSPPMYVGNYTTFIATTTGSLELAINDALTLADLADNVGSIVVRIMVSKSR